MRPGGCGPGEVTRLPHGLGSTPASYFRRRFGLPRLDAARADLISTSRLRASLAPKPRMDRMACRVALLTRKGPCRCSQWLTALLVIPISLAYSAWDKPSFRRRLRMPFAVILALRSIAGAAAVAGAAA